MVGGSDWGVVNEGEEIYVVVLWSWWCRCCRERGHM